MKNITLTCISVFLLATCSFAQIAPPTLSWSLDIENGQKHYQYVVTNTATWLDGNPVDVWNFDLIMPLNGELSIESHNEPSGWTYISRGLSVIQWRTEYYQLKPGETAIFEIYTASSVPTAYSYGDMQYNWVWGCLEGGSNCAGNSNVAIPGEIPEPSSLLALIGCLAGIGGIAWRRRR